MRFFQFEIRWFKRFHKCEFYTIKLFRYCFNLKIFNNSSHKVQINVHCIFILDRLFKVSYSVFYYRLVKPIFNILNLSFNLIFPHIR